MSNGYVALVHKPQAGSTWGITFPDLPGCVSSGANFEEAAFGAVEALAGHVAAIQADGDPVPRARSFFELSEDAAFLAELDEDASPMMVALIPIAAPKERINIMIDRGVLRRVDQAARAEGISRSAFLERAAAAVIVE
ncbi:DNA-binding protein, CopG family [Bosea sp. LC85]|uniref:type II toxin-antitoxin system HicB family antitoxin n=1 Tax=Bosea sp. LC85 TaxID=1502851 RepID=UPI0004E320A3|nr:type II toxin-antitoxin system HicB family antitoxin [Bosea sp. LC85]KFC72219.1 DNA-binding protein, CopG family [Bosea sp. LC85]